LLIDYAKGGITAGGHASSTAAFAERIGAFFLRLPAGTVGGNSAASGANGT